MLWAEHLGETEAVRRDKTWWCDRCRKKVSRYQLPPPTYCILSHPHIFINTFTTRIIAWMCVPAASIMAIKQLREAHASRFDITVRPNWYTLSALCVCVCVDIWGR